MKARKRIDALALAAAAALVAGCKEKKAERADEPFDACDIALGNTNTIFLNPSIIASLGETAALGSHFQKST